MKTTLNIGLVLLVVVAFFFMPSPAKGSSQHSNRSIRVFYTSNRQGEIEPCQCQDRLGGVGRLDDYLRRNDYSDRSLWVDSGDTFFSAPSLNTLTRDEDVLRAKTLARAFALLNLSAFTPGERDFAAGLAQLKELEALSKADFVATNLVDLSGEPVFERFKLLEKSGKKIAVFGLLSPDIVSKSKEVQVLPPFDALRAAIKEVAGQSVDLMIVLSHLGLKQDKALAAAFPIDLIVGAHSMDVLQKPVEINKAAIVQPLNLGQQVGWVELPYRKGDPVRHSLVDLDSRFEPTSRMNALLSSYRAQIRRTATSLPTSMPEGVPSKRGEYVAHPFLCKRCHEAQYNFWKNTKHASAYLILYAKEEHFDPACIGCHTLGYREPGGFTKRSAPLILEGFPEKDRGGLVPVEQLMKKIFSKYSPQDVTDFRKKPKVAEDLRARYHAEMDRLNKEHRVIRTYLNVQCEHCHGNRQEHLRGKKLASGPVKEETCRACHRPPNAPDFDPAWRVRVACPRMTRLQRN